MRLAEQLHQLVLSSVGILEFIHENMLAIFQNLGGGSEEFEAKDQKVVEIERIGGS